MKQLRFQEGAGASIKGAMGRLWPLAVTVLVVGSCAAAQAIPDLIRAIKGGDAAKVRQLTDLGAGLNVADSQGMTPLMWAANQGNTEFVRMLLSKGAELNSADAFGWTALIHAAGAGYTDTVQALLQGGAVVSARASNGITALIAAAGHPETVKKLLAHGADPLAQSHDGTTVLLAAKTLGNVAVVQLIEAAVSPDLAQREDTVPAEQSPVTPRPDPVPPAIRDAISVSGVVAEYDPHASPANTAQRQETTNERVTAEASPSKPGSEDASNWSLTTEESYLQTKPTEPEHGRSSQTQPFAPPSTPQSEGVYLQVGSFHAANRAEELAARLGMRGHPSVLHKRSGQYLLMVGPFLDQYSAINYREKLDQDSFESFIARLPNDMPALDAYTPPAETRRLAENTSVVRGTSLPRPAASIPEVRAEQQNTSPTQIYLQVGAFRAGGNARIFANEFGKEHKPMVQTGADGWFRVLVGPFANKEAALAYREKLSTEGHTSVLRLP